MFQKKLKQQRIVVKQNLPITPNKLIDDNLSLITAGLDEVGRGCLAGPVVAGAVILPDTISIDGLADSKTISSNRRYILAKKIYETAISWGLGVVWPKEIDEINILQASLKAMAHAATVLKTFPELLLIDGNKTIPQKFFIQFGWNVLPIQYSIIKGDASIPAISAASIIAKTFRDTLMSKLDKRYPQYNFSKNKGYGSKKHRKILQKIGPSPIHRMTFKGVISH